MTTLADKELKKIRKSAIKAIKRGESVIYNCEIVGNTIQAYGKLNCLRSVVMHHYIKVQKYDNTLEILEDHNP